LRLWDSRKGKWGGINPHDKFEMMAGSTTGYLKGDLLHYTAESEEEYLKKMERYTDIASQALFEQGKTANMPVIYAKTAFTFIRNYMLRLGFLDGKAGYDLGRISAHYTYQKYRKLFLLNRGKPH
jgi:hypothetical protein